MNKKGNFQIIAGIVVIVLFIILIYYILPQFSAPVRFEIKLQENNISQYQNGVLFYKITNNKEGTVYNLKINNSIINYESNSNLHEEKTLLDIPKNQFVDGNYNFYTGYLPKGSYIIKSIISYTYQNKNDSSELTLQFSVV